MKAKKKSLSQLELLKGIRKAMPKPSKIHKGFKDYKRVKFNHLKED